MNEINRELANVMTQLQIAAQGQKEPINSTEEYAADIKERITNIERELDALKFVLTKHHLNDWE